MNSHPIFKELIPVEIALSDLCLDPNNPRFTGDKWSFINENDTSKPSVQESVSLKLQEEFGVDKLLLSMEMNGYLPIDRVIVKELPDKKYVVLEGNRRICAAKLLIAKAESSFLLVDSEVIDSLKMIPCLLYTGTDSQASWVFQGLRHISGIREWSAFNKAKHLVNLMEEEDLTLTQVGSMFGLTAFGAGQWVRGYYAYRQACESSDYVSEVDEKSYPYFQEVFNKSCSSIREWMEWSDSSKKFNNELNFNEFIGWLYPRSDSNSNTDDNGIDCKGDWNARWIQRAIDIRLISFLLKENTVEFDKFRSDGDLQKAYNRAIQQEYDKQEAHSADPVESLFESLRSCTKLLENIPYKVLKDITYKQKVNELIIELEKAISIVKE